MPVLIVILIISFLVIIHELGHFIAAKRARIKVEEFGIGYPPKLFTLFKKDGTEFTFNLIPVGGFVRLEGENGPSSEEKGEKTETTKQDSAPFYKKSASKRLGVILAGVVVNLVFAVAAFSVVFSFKGIPIPLENQARVGWISDNSPAANAGVATNINILEVKSHNKNYKINDISDVQQAVLESRGQNLTLITTEKCTELSCGEETLEFQVYARTEDETPENQGSLGIVFKDYVLKFYPWYLMPVKATVYGTKQALVLGWMILGALAKVFADLLSKGTVSKDVAGPVGIVHQAQQGDLVSQDFLANLGFAGMLSLNLAVMNLLPIPALDGGKALFILLEKVFNKDKIQKIESYASYGGFFLLLALIIAITIQDVIRIFN